MTNDYDKIHKRLHIRLPQLLHNGEVLGLGRAIWYYRRKQFQKHNPTVYANLENNILINLMKLREAIQEDWEKHKNISSV